MREQIKPRHRCSSLSLTLFTLHLERGSNSGLAAKGSKNISTISGKPGGLPGSRRDLGTSGPDRREQDKLGRPTGKAGMFSKNMRVKNDGDQEVK